MAHTKVGSGAHSLLVTSFGGGRRGGGLGAENNMMKRRDNEGEVR